MSITLLSVLVLFFLGAAAGSFTSVVIYRLHSEKKGILTGRSSCPDCETQLQPLDLVPIASYLTLRGKCRYCSREISYMYPLLEIATGLLFGLFFFKFPFVNEALQFSGPMLGLYLLHVFYTFVLVFTFFYDLHYLQVADEILLPAVLIGLIATIAAPLTPSFIDAILGALISLVFFGSQILISRGKWMGQGDLRVGVFMGVILGWKLTILALFMAYMSGSIAALFIIAKKKQWRGIRMPFAPFLVIGTFGAMFFGEAVLQWYLQGF